MRHILIDVTQQKLFLFNQGILLADYAISSAKNGLGEREGSECTPRGWHTLAELIGENMPIGMRFKARVPVGLFQGEEQDPVLTRIIRLKGRESGFNLGANCDTFDRYIYIHGTRDDYPMGVPLSHGCIRMRNQDILSLFSSAVVNASVYIH